MVVFSSFFFFKQKTAYEMRISDWSSDVCSSDLQKLADAGELPEPKSAEEVREKINEANLINASVRRLKQLDDLIAAVGRAEAEAEQLTKDIDRKSVV